MAKEVVIKADKKKKRNKRYSKTKIILSAILLFFIFSFIILSIIYKGGNLFRTHGLNMKEFIIMFILSISVLPVDFIRKIIIKMLYGKSDV